VWRVAWSTGGKNGAASMARGICVFFGKMRRPLPWRKQQEGDWWSAGAELGVVHEGRMHA